jgi:FlaA1/EpsC-like NDP-sugar epimerase
MGTFKGYGRDGIAMNAINTSAGDWEQLLGRSIVPASQDRFSALHTGKAVMITGAGGSIGAALALQIAQSNPRVLVLLDASEQNLYQLDISLIRRNKHMRGIPVLGSVLDQSLLEDTLRQHRPEIIYHAAAHKHVPMMEANPFAAIRNNALGTDCLARAASKYCVGRLLMISTDKAVNPISIMGASKRIAELALQSASSPQTRMDSIRLGNVLGTEGSVVPLFLDQILRGGPVTVTHPDAERFFFTLDETVALVFEAASHGRGGQIIIPHVDKPTKILALAEYLIRKHNAAPVEEISIVATGLRPGEKMQEEFLAADEVLQERIGERLYCVQSSLPHANGFASSMTALDRTLGMRDLAAMLRLVRRLVPQYRPGAHLSTMRTVPPADLYG